MELPFKVTPKVFIQYGILNVEFVIEIDGKKQTFRSLNFCKPDAFNTLGRLGYALKSIGNMMIKTSQLKMLSPDKEF